MLIPQAIAYAFLAGIPPVYGLYSAIIPLIIYAAFGTSQHLSIGPVAITSILIMAGISKVATPFSMEFVHLVLLCGFLVGLVQIIMGILRLGFIVTVLAQPVISGFISAAAIIIIISQIKSGFGIAMPANVSAFQSLKYWITHINESHIVTLSITLISVVVMLIFRRINKAFPAALVLIIVFTALSYFFNLEAEGVAILGEIPSGLPEFYILKLDWDTIQTILPTVLSLTIIGYLGSIGIAKSFQMKHRNYEVNANKELIALGMAKLVGTFFQGNLASGSYSRSAINEDAGAQTTLAAVITAALIFASLLFLTPLLYFLPKPVLAAIILVSVFSLIKVEEAKRYLRIRLDDFAIMLFTFIVTLFVSIEAGILAGILLSFIFLQYQSSKPHIAELVKIPGSSYYRNLNRFPNGEQDQRYVILRFDDHLYFGNADYFKESIYKYIEKRSTPPTYVIIHGTNIHNIDSTGLTILEDLCRDLATKDVNLLFTSLIGPVRDKLTRSGFSSQLKNQFQFMSIKDAVGFINTAQQETVKISAQDLVLQYNKRQFKLTQIFIKLVVFFKKK